ncbi:lysoplasmalogenase [Yinghuangia soli]|uniref:Lysoplasmalogenase n=1 Tax=Yinghuangia soli TaxID=2908204 RepID=A0AA41Q5R5_9ACTN|nr:lysoplasmalogenase [Yinghuangia soli]MCF2530652.1 lysoplasmalogenase [Yinghuangia soli]
MTPLAWTLFAMAAVLAVVDWVAVGREDTRLERRAKPAVMAALIAAAAALDPNSQGQRAAFLVALGLSLIRDLLPTGDRRRFPAAVAAALGAHTAYVVGFQQVGWSWLWAAAGIVVVLVATLGFAVHLVLGVRATEPRLTFPVVAYIGVLSLMVVAASATGQPTAVAGAFLFYCADALTGWNRFREPTAYARPLIAVSYHLAQFLLVISLV